MNLFMEKDIFSYNLNQKVPKEVFEDFRKNFVEFVSINYKKAEINKGELLFSDLKKGMVITFHSTKRGDFSSDPILMFDNDGASFTKGKCERKRSSRNHWSLLGTIDLDLKFKNYKLIDICSSCLKIH